MVCLAAILLLQHTPSLIGGTTTPYKWRCLPLPLLPPVLRDVLQYHTAVHRCRITCHRCLSSITPLGALPWRP